MKRNLLTLYLMRMGIVCGALAAEVDKLDGLPEYQRVWYQPGENGKFKLDLTKVEVGDTQAMQNTIAATRREADEARRSREQAIKDALKPYDGIDPQKVRTIMAQFASEEEAALIAKGPDGISEVINRRMARREEELQGQVAEAKKGEEGAIEVARKFMDKVLDGQVAAAATEAGVHPSAIPDVLLRARAIFDVDDEGNAVQLGQDGQPVIGKDGKNPFTPKEWIEDMRKTAPHWFPAAASGGGAAGDRGARGKVDMSGWTPQQRITYTRTGQMPR